MNFDKLKQKIIDCIEQEGFSFVDVKRGLFFSSDAYFYERKKDEQNASIKLVTSPSNDRKGHLIPIFSANISTELRDKVYKLINEHKDEVSIQLNSLTSSKA